MNVLKHLDSAVVRIVVMVCIVGLSLIDPVKALLLAIILVVALQTLSNLKRAKPKVNVITLVNDLVNTLKNNVMNNDKELDDANNDGVSDEASDEAGDEGSDAAFDETSDTDLVNNATMENIGLEANDLLSPEKSELLNN